MEHDGTVTIDAERDAVWTAVTDPGVLTACVMGAEEVRQVAENTYEGVVRQEVAGVSVTMTGEIEITSMEHPTRMAFTGVGTDQRTGSRMQGDATVELDAVDDGTLLAYDVDVTFTGRLATLGARILRRQIRANVELFFDTLAEHVEETG